MMQPDLGTSLVLLAILGGMLFMSGASLRWLGVIAIAVLAALPFVWNNVLRDYQQQRILGFLDPSTDIQGAGWQLHQSQIAVGSGGVFGKGLTNGTQNQLNFLPVQESDFVAADLPGGAGVPRCDPAARAVRGASLADPGQRLAIEGPLRDDVRGRARVDAPVPARRQPRDGRRDHADHRHPAAVRLPWRRVADQHRRRTGHPPEHQHPADSRRVVTRLTPRRLSRAVGLSAA